MVSPLLNALDVMILTRMLFSCLVDAEFLDTAVIAVCFDCTVAPHAGSVDLKYAEAVKRPSQGMYRDGRWCIFGVIPYLTAIGGRYAVQYSKKRDD